ncbi:serine/threonine protein kinase [candidate division KSB1 bacterium]|nr:serine/threonine protein kinase [candidate division KSB1 bacterium]
MTEKINKYEIQQVISKGSLTTVYLAHHPSLGREVLLKVFSPHLSREKDLVERFVREAQICARLKHPNIVTVYDFGQWEGSPFMVLEFVKGQSLKDIIEQRGKLPPVVAFYLLWDVLKGLGCAHDRGVIHRDIKPANLLVSQEGEAKITDFGLAWAEGAVTLTAPGSIVGTPCYMSPEQVGGRGLDGRSDIFSLGATFYEALSGKRAFGGDSFSECFAKILTEDPPDLRDLELSLPTPMARIVMKMMGKKASKRYKDCSEILVDLDKLGLDEDPSWSREAVQDFLQGAGETRVAGARVWSGRRKIWAVLGMAAALLLLAGGFWGLRFQKPMKAEKDKGTLSGAVDSVGVPKEGGLKSSLGIRLAEERRGGPRFPLPELGVPPPPEILISREKEKYEPLPEVFELMTNRQVGGYLGLDCLPWAEVFIDDSSYGVTPLTGIIPIQTGTHLLRLIHPDYPPYAKEFTIAPEETLRMNLSLIGNFSYLKLLVYPWAEVFIDGVPKGTTPLRKPLVLTPGEHVVVLKNPSFPQWEDKVQLERGKTLELKIRLPRE